MMSEQDVIDYNLMFVGAILIALDYIRYIDDLILLILLPVLTFLYGLYRKEIFSYKKIQHYPKLVKYGLKSLIVVIGAPIGIVFFIVIVIILFGSGLLARIPELVNSKLNSMYIKQLKKLQPDMSRGLKFWAPRLSNKQIESGLEHARAHFIAALGVIIFIVGYIVSLN